MDSLFDEIESLEAILMDDVTIHRNPKSNNPEIIETTIFPIVGDTDRQCICVTLQVIPKDDYPDVSPEFRLIKPRGLDDARLNEIVSACHEKLNESLGFPVVFDLIEVVREHLTVSNLPSGQCVICLYGFQDSDEFTKTECYHYLHSFCLYRHLIASQKNWQEEQNKLPAWLQKTSEPFKAVCPVCREPITDDADALKDSLPPKELQNAPDFQLTDELKQLQMKMYNLFTIQKKRGAIIEMGEHDGNVISIEPEVERRDHRRKTAEHEDNAENSNSTVPNSHSKANRHNQNRNQNNRIQQNNACTSADASGTTATAAPAASNSRIVVNHTNFQPIVNNSPRYTAEPTNNNYNHQQHYNRRHYRGNRRHYNHRDHRDHSSQQSVQQQKDEKSQETSNAPTNHSNNKQQKSGANGHHGGNSTHKR